MPRPSQPLDAERERRLVATAARAFTEVGYELASLNVIVAEAGWAKSSFYHYFPDKQRLHDHVVSTLREAGRRRVVLPDVQGVDEDAYWDATSAAVASVVVAVVEDAETRMLVRMFSHPLAARGPTGLLTLLRADVRRWLAAWLARGQELRLVRDDLPLDLLVELTVGALSAALDWATSIPTPPARAAEDVAGALRGLLRTDASPRTA